MPKPPSKPAGKRRNGLKDAPVAIALSSEASVAARTKALARLTSSVCEDKATFDAVLGIVRDTSAPGRVRLAALATIQAASFRVLKFNRFRPAYLKVLRSLIEDRDLELRQRVLGFLAREKDAVVQTRLVEGLKNPASALVPPEKALQLLGYDVHADAYAVARDVVQNPPNMEARREALRILSADSASAPVFETLLRDKSEPIEIRRLSASALHTMAPARLQAHAREIVLDPSDDAEIHATSLTALTHFGTAEKLGADAELKRQAKQLSMSESPGVKDVAAQFLSKYHS